MLEYNRNLKNISRNLRNNMTPEEIILWSRIKSKKVKNAFFSRQKVIGNYIVDFYCSEYKLVIELDGGHHFRDNKEKEDIKRDNFLKEQGIKVLRFSNLDIRKNLNGVLEKLYTKLKH